MLKLIGHTFENLEETVVHELYHKTPYMRWSDWTNCTENGANAFGFQTRVPKCWYNSSDACVQDGSVTIETALKLCKGRCRHDYIVSKHGFSITFHDVRYGVTQGYAENKCQSEGGHLMNVDTKGRWIDHIAVSRTG